MITKSLKIFAIAALSIGFPMLSSCADKEPDPTETAGNDFVIDERNFNVDKDGKTINIDVKTTIHNSKWIIECPDNDWVLYSKKGPSDGVGTLSITVKENNTGADRQTTVTVSTTTVSIPINITQWADNELHIEGDIPVRPTRATADSYHSGEDASKSFDDDTETIFHSDWSNGSARFPFNLTYYFDGSETIDYIEYVPRKGGGNGCFGEFELYVNETSQSSNLNKIGDYNFNFSSSPGRVSLPAGLKPKSVKFVVKTGLGNHVSCAEMRFFRNNTDTSLNRELLEVFTDLTCSELKPGVTDEQIESLDANFKRIAQALRDNSYNELEKSFRVHEYNAYSNPVEFSTELMTKIYSNWDNPMGIEVQKGQQVLILVGDTHGNNLSVQIVGEYQKVDDKGNKSWRPQSQGTFHALREGVNQIEADQDGQLFLMYTAVPSAATSLPIKVHVPPGNGTFAGYWSLAEHKTDEKFLEIRNATKNASKYFCVVGDRMLLYFQRSLFKREIVDAITQWDRIITWQQNFMGIEDVRPARWNNHIAGISLEAGAGDYMWASDWVMGFVDSKISSEDIMGLKHFNAAADNAWGPAHEMGHVNQKAINWASTTESSNNLFSNYVLEQFGAYNSRGKGLQYRMDAVYANNQSWASMCSSNNGPSIPKVKDNPEEYFDEDTDVHMRLNWQLYLYFHRVLKRTDFFGKVFKAMRDLGMNETENCGKKQLEFAAACSEQAGLDLTDFFEAWGFFKPHTSKISQYGTYDYKVTEMQIQNCKARMARFPKPNHAFEYIEDRCYANQKPNDFKYDKIGDLGFITTFEKAPAIASSAKATVSGRTVTTSGCDNAVAIEVRVRSGNDYGDIRYASNFKTFTIPQGINISGCAVYAVSAKGERKLLANL